MKRVNPYSIQAVRSITRPTPIFEPLETRTHFSVTLTAGVLQVTTGSGNDAISVDEVYDRPDVMGTTFYVDINGAPSGSFFGEDVASIHVDSGAGNDQVTVAFCGGGQNVVANLGDGNDKFREIDPSDGCEVHAGAGNDDIQGTDYRDLLDGGPGNDKIDALSDDDTIIPGGGLDSVTGGDGDDIGANYNDIPTKADGSVIEAENFDEGSEGHGYHDTDTTNLFTDTYRSDTGVDIFAGFGSTGHAVGSFVPTEWLQYTITVPTTGTYNFTARYATPINGDAFKLFSDGAALTGNVALPTTAAWNTFTDRTVSISLTAGTHVLRLANVGSNAFNFDSFHVNLVPPTTGDISGTVFNDLNQNKVKDAAEHGIAGVKVYLDTNNNGNFNTGETFVNTNANGQYAFHNVHPAIVHVREVLPAGFRYVVGSPDHHDVKVLAGGNTINQNFALTNKPLITGKVFLDTNGNGAQNTGEHGLAGWVVYADLNHDGIFEAGENSKTTDANGNFSFAALSPGSYVLRVLGPSGYHQTTPAANGGLHVTVAAGQVVNAGAFGEQLIV